MISLEIILPLSIAVLIILIAIWCNRRDKIDLKGRHILITGGSSGIGYDLCIEAFKQGANVSIIARNKERLNAVKEELESLRSRNNKNTQIVQIESLDISKNFEDVQTTVDKLTKNSGPIDILINNAGIFDSKEFGEMDVPEFENIMKVNYIGSVYCTRAVLNSMKSRKFGRIAFVSSQAGQIGVFGYTAYSASKYALRGFAGSLQMELKPYNIYVTLSYPPDTDTPGLKQELLARSDEANAIIESSGVCSSKKVAKGILKSVKNGSFSSYFGFNGFFLSLLTTGDEPATSFFDLLAQLILMPFARLYIVFMLIKFDRAIKSIYIKKNKI